eukprot:3674153-Rhodomonas_salina.1
MQKIAACIKHASGIVKRHVQGAEITRGRRALDHTARRNNNVSRRPTLYNVRKKRASPKGGEALARFA